VFIELDQVVVVHQLGVLPGQSVIVRTSCRGCNLCMLVVCRNLPIRAWVWHSISLSRYGY
jgi:hypothetical protein